LIQVENIRGTDDCDTSECLARSYTFKTICNLTGIKHNLPDLNWMDDQTLNLTPSIQQSLDLQLILPSPSFGQ